MDFIVDDVDLEILITFDGVLGRRLAAASHYKGKVQCWFQRVAKRHGRE